MKIIGWERKGNVVKFALGDNHLKDWSGDDWNDAPYEHNACTTPLFGIEKYLEVAFTYESSILEPCDDYNYHGNSPFCMDDFKERKVPFMIIDTTGEEMYYSKALLNNKNAFVFMGNNIDKIQWDKLNGTIIG